MSRKLAFWTGALALLACGGASAWADTVQLDQQYFDSSGTPGVQVVDRNNWEEFAQTFTVGLTGVFDHLDLDLSAVGRTDTFTGGTIYGSGDLIVDLRTTSSGAPTVPNSGANILGSVTIAGSALPHSTSGSWMSIDFSGLGLSVTSGQVLAFAIRDAVWNHNGNPAFTDVYGGITSPTYSGGSAWILNQSGPFPLTWSSRSADLDFRTYVYAPTPVVTERGGETVPLPSSAWMGLGVLAGAGGIGWLKRRSRLSSL